MTSTLTADQLVPYLTGARWFGGKGRRVELRALKPLPWITAPTASDEPFVRFEVAELGYPDEPKAATDHYLLGVSYRRKAQPQLEHARIGSTGEGDSTRIGYDAMRDPQACRAILTALLEARQLQDANSAVRFELTKAHGLSTELEPRVFPGQQSNTSVMFGDVAMIKFFRRLELGRNLDIEVHDALNRAAVADVAHLFGWIEGSWLASEHEQPVHADLAMVVEKLADAQDGWDLALGSIPQDTDDGAEHPTGFVNDARALGTALAETHAALRSAFPTARLEGAEVATVMKDRLHRASEAANALEPYVDGLLRRFDELGATRLDTQRLHGDFHLGQTLRTPGGWKIIDFEGEPAKSLAERAAPDSVYRDIAGMLRSFDYAAGSAPGPASASWAAECRSAFLNGYTASPLDALDAAVLRAYEADKAIYEVVYEVRNRPDWVHIPLAAVAALAAADDTDLEAGPINFARSGGPENSPHLAKNQVEE